MALSSGTKLGPYEIRSLLGTGGMGEVYRALDVRLNRTVAIKVLASHLSSSPELKQRMEREARTVSSLNHPSICQLYDIGSENGADYLVMEFLEGETLAERLRRGPMALEEVYRIGMGVAEALETAHRRAIVHRDLKPANIMLTKTGIKLMDFGLAKPLCVQAVGAAPVPPPSFTAVATLSGASPISPLTTAGTIVGTIQYMSPEQLEGKEADARSDIFALGAVLYEMAAGKRPFDGKSQISVASAILEKEPEPICSLQPLAPPAFEHLLKTCLEKNPEERFQSARDVKIDLRWIATDKSVAQPVLPARPSNKNKERLLWAAIAVALLLGALGARFFGRPPAPGSIRLAINPPSQTTLNLTGDFAGPPVISPDGSLVAFTATAAEGKSALWLRPMNSLEAHPLPDTDGAVFPFWSPDSRSLAFFAGSKLKTIDISSGFAQVLADAPFGRGGAWGAGGMIVFAPNTQAPLMRVSSLGGVSVSATSLDPIQHTSHRWPFFLPDGKHFLYLAIQHDPSKSANDTLFYASLDGHENRPLFHSRANAIYAAGYLLFARDDQLMAQPFDPASGRLSGTPHTVVRGMANDISTWHMDASASDNGLLITASGGSADWQLVSVERGGKQITPIADKVLNLQEARVSPQGDRVALQLNNAQADIWVLDLARGVRTRLTFGPVANQFPVWSPDGKWIAYTSGRSGHSEIFRKPSDGSGSEELLLTDSQTLITKDWSHDGKYVIYSRGMPGGNSEIWALPLAGERKPFLVIPHSTFGLGASGSISPDGRWIAYSSDESGNVETYVAAFRGQAKWQVSASGGSSPEWSKNGKELYYMDPSSTLFAVPVKPVNGALEFGSPQMLVSNWSSPQVFYDVFPDEKRILLDRVSQQVNQSVMVLTNFTAVVNK